MEIKLRSWCMEDLEKLILYANNPKIAANLTDGFPNPYTKEKGVAFIEMALKSDPSTLLAIDLNGETIGGIGIHLQSDVYSKNAELGYWLGEPFWGRGIATAAILKMIDYGFDNFPINRIFARPFGSNIGSQKVLKKAGFKLEAKLDKTVFKNGKFEDELIYAIRKL